MLFISESTFVTYSQEFTLLREHLMGSIEVVNTLNSLQCLTMGTALSLKTPCLQNHHFDNYFYLCLKIFLCTLRLLKRREKDGSPSGCRDFLSSVGAMLIQSKIRNLEIYMFPLKILVYHHDSGFLKSFHEGRCFKL